MAHYNAIYLTGIWGGPLKFCDFRMALSPSPMGNEDPVIQEFIRTTGALSALRELLCHK